MDQFSASEQNDEESDGSSQGMYVYDFYYINFRHPNIICLMRTYTL